MFARRLQLLCGSISFVVAMVSTPLSLAQSDEKITPSQAEAMLRVFMESTEGAAIGFQAGEGGNIPPRECSAFVDPHVDCIRWGGNYVDRVDHIVRMLGGKIQASFVKRGDEYVIEDAHEVKVNKIDGSEAMAMVLGFLSSNQAAGMPPWVLDSRKIIEANPVLGGSIPPVYVSHPDSLMHVGSWIVDPYVRIVLLATGDSELSATFEWDGEDYTLENVLLKEANRIELAEAKAMLLRFLATAEEQQFDHRITDTLKLVEDSTPSLFEGETPWGTFRNINVGPWWLDTLTQSIDLTTPIGASTKHFWYGMFTKEDGIYTIHLLWESGIRVGMSSLPGPAGGSPKE